MEPYLVIHREVLGKAITYAALMGVVKTVELKNTVKREDIESDDFTPPKELKDTLLEITKDTLELVKFLQAEEDNKKRGR